MNLLQQEQWQQELHTKWAGRTCLYYDSIDSTNLRGKALAEKDACHGVLIAAEEQLSGRGRLGRVWQSPKGKSISMSLVLQPGFQPRKASMLTLVAAVSLRKAIFQVTGLETEIKWPNDIVYQGKKLCGILTEMSAISEQIRYVVIGMGMNVNIEVFPEELPYATSLLLALGHPVERMELMQRTMEAFEMYYELFLQTEDLSLIKAEYQTFMAGRNRLVQVLEKEPYCGTCMGISEEGALLVKDQTGSVHQVQSGEVSVRGVYGYI